MPKFLSDSDFEKQFGSKKTFLSDEDFAAKFDAPAKEPAQAPGVLDQLKGMFVPSEPDFETYTPLPREKFLGSDEEFNAYQKRAVKAQIQTKNLNDMSKLLSFAQGADVTGLGLKAADAIRPGTQKTVEEERARNPKTALAGGMVAPIGSELKVMVPVAFGVGALNAAAHDQNPLAGGAVNAAVAAATHGVFKLGGAAASKVLGRQMSATLGPEGAVFQAGGDLERMAGMREPGTVSSEPFTGQQYPGAPREGTAIQFPEQLRPERGTDVQYRRAAGGALDAPAPGEMTSPGGRRGGPGERTAVMEPGAEPKTFTGPSTPEERALAMSEAGKTRLTIPGVSEDPLAQVERIAKEMGLRDVPQGLNEKGQYPGFDVETHDVGPRARPLGEPTYIERGLQGGRETVSSRPPSKFQEAMDFLTGDDVGTAKTVTKYVPRDSLLPRSQQNPEATFVSSKRLDPAVGGGAGVPPHPVNPEAQPVPGPPFEQGPLLPIDVPDTFAVHAAEAEQALKKDKSLWETVKRGLSLPENRADDEVAAAIRSFRAARSMREVGLKLHEKLQDTLKDLPPVERARVQRIVTGLRDRKLGREAVADLPPAFRDLFMNLEREKQEMLIGLVREGYYTPQQMLSIKKLLDDGGLHLHRSYQAFLNKRGYNPTAESISEAARFVAKDQGLPEYAATAAVKAQVKRLLAGESVPNEQGLAAALRDSGLMKGRTLPPAFRKLLGVIDDPAFIVADTVGEMAQQYHLSRATNAFAAPEYRGKVWSDSAAPGFDPRRLWVEGKSPAENKQLFGELAGKWVKPELYEAMAQQATPEAQSLRGQIMNAAVGLFSTAKVTSSPATWLRNLLSNTYNLSVSGVPPWRYMRPKYVMQALESIKALKGSTSMKRAGAGEWARMAREDWAIPEGRGTDWGGAEAQRIVNEAVRGAEKNGFFGAMDSIFRLVNKGRGKLGEAYEFADQLPRLIGYMYHVEQGVQMGMPEMAARARASQLINKYFATGASVGPALRGLAKSGGAPFASWFVDNMRVAKNIGADAFRGDFGPLTRSALFMGSIAGAFYAMRHLGGFTDTDVAAGNRALKGTWDNNNAFHDWLPVRGKNGEMYAVSFDGLNPMATFFKGPPGSPAKNVAANIVRGVTQSGYLQLPADLLLAQAGVAPQEYRPPILPGQEGTALANSAWQYMQPTMVAQFRNVLRKAQLSPEPLRDTEQPESLPEALLLHGPAMPLSIEKVGPRTQEGARRQLQGAVGELKDARKAVKRLPAEEGAKVREEANRRLMELRGKQAR